VFGPGVYAAVAVTQQAWATEQVLTEHYKTHTTADYVRTMYHQRTELERLAQQERVARQEATDYQQALAAVMSRLGMPGELSGEVADDQRRVLLEIARLRGLSAASGRGWAQ
jgi:hypothetical protein